MYLKNKSGTTHQKKNLLFLAFFISCLLGVSWDTASGIKKENDPGVIAKPAFTSTIVLENCYFTAAQLKTLLQDNVRKIMLQYVNDGSSKTILVAYGTDKDNETLTGPVYSAIVPGSVGVPIPQGGILGNLIIRRGQLKQLFGHREGKHERITEAKIRDIVLKPQTTLLNSHVWYKMNIYNNMLLIDDLPVNPSPPAKPCEDCENYGTDN